MVFAVSSYFICCHQLNLFDLQLVLLNSNGISRTVYTGRGKAIGFHMDSRACVLLLERGWGERMVLFHAGRTLKSREMLRICDSSLAVRCRI